MRGSAREALGLCDGGAILPGVPLHRPRRATATALVEIEGPAGRVVEHVLVCDGCVRDLYDEPGMRVLVIVRRGQD